LPIFRPQRKRPAGGAKLGDTPTAITRRALESALASARSSFPNEFGGANFQLWMLHADLSVAGTVHSHPSGALRPSDADLRLFRSWGRRHLILGAPFGQGAWRAYDGNGRETNLRVVETAGGVSDRPVGRYARPEAPPTEPEDAFSDDEA
jgi:hypothetical protein